uniref:Uncharacterized protein n=1 Tax=Opuntia streptacantha TaxID=393608 RepID=A0A7C9EGI4_OPUST
MDLPLHHHCGGDAHDHSVFMLEIENVGAVPCPGVEQSCLPLTLDILCLTSCRFQMSSHNDAAFSKHPQHSPREFDVIHLETNITKVPASPRSNVKKLNISEIRKVDSCYSLCCFIQSNSLPELRTPLLPVQQSSFFHLCSL